MNALNSINCDLSLLVSIITICMCIYIMVFMHNISKYLFKKNEITKYNIDISCPIKQDEVDEELNNFIKGRWEEYYICNLGWQNLNNVTQKQQEDIMIEMGNIINNTISPILLTKLSRFYNSEKNKNGVSGIDQIIADRIQIIVLNYSVETNRIK